MSKPRTIMIYGDSGATKTTQAYFLAKYLTTKYPSTKIRVIGSNASDNAPFEDSGMIERGTIDFFDISNRQLALADMRRLSEGYWPRDVKIKGDKAYFHTDDKCLTSQSKWDDISGYIIEGATGVSALLLNHIRQQEEGVGFKHSFKYEEDGYIIGGLQEGHYGIVQQELYKIMVQGFATLPVKFVIWTALTGKGEDKRTRTTIYGPKGAGDAKTFEMPAWFMDCFHLSSIMVQADENDPEKKAEQKIAWFVKHPDSETGVDYLAKARILPELYPELIKKFPYGYVPLGFKSGLDRYYLALDEIVNYYRTQNGAKSLS